MARIPPSNAISHVREATDDSLNQETTTGSARLRTSTKDTDTPRGSFTPASFRVGLPPLPGSLIKRIQDGEFIDMSELTVDCLSMLPFEEASKSSQSKRRLVTSIIEWSQCFTHYIAILSQTKPERLQDLLGYHYLILEAHLEFAGEGWAVYDRRYRQTAAAHPGTAWSQRDGDLWHMIFGSLQRRPYCQHCFGSTHSSEQCSTGSETASKGKTGYTQRPRKPKICYGWNYTQCSFPGCQYIHACATCYGDPGSGDSNHKYIHCPRNPNRQLEYSVRPLMGPPRPY